MNSAVAWLEPAAREAQSAALRVPKYFDRKRLAVRVLGLALLIVAAPVIAILCVLIRLSSRGSAIFRQVRIGKDGKPYQIYKLRTMRADAESLTGPVWCSSNDSRVTPLGRALRYLHLDELPQLWNVVRGEMDLIGPRPERPEIIAAEKLADRVGDYASRLRVLPGVTGLAQINLPADQTIDCVQRKVALDMEYINTASLGLDLRILACTAFRMLGVRHGIAVRFFGLSRPAPTTAKPAAATFCSGVGPPAAEDEPPMNHREAKRLAAYLYRTPTPAVDLAIESENGVAAAIARKHPR